MGTGDAADLPMPESSGVEQAGTRGGIAARNPAEWAPADATPAGPSVFFLAALVDVRGDHARLERPRQLEGFLPARNVWSLNPWHFESRFPAAKCVI
jgi:hypothetical protein